MDQFQCLHFTALVRRFAVTSGPLILISNRFDFVGLLPRELEVLTFLQQRLQAIADIIVIRPVRRLGSHLHEPFELSFRGCLRCTDSGNRETSHRQDRKQFSPTHSHDVLLQNKAIPVKTARDVPPYLPGISHPNLGTNSRTPAGILSGVGQLVSRDSLKSAGGTRLGLRRPCACRVRVPDFVLTTVPLPKLLRTCRSNEYARQSLPRRQDAIPTCSHHAARF